MDDKIRVLFVCHGNICRSPMAEFVFRRITEERGLSSRFETASAGTSGEHEGEPPDRRTMAELVARGIPCAGKTSRRLRISDFGCYDYIVGMDSRNMENILRLRPEGSVCEIRMLGEYCGSGEVADPYYTGNFTRTYREVLAGCEGLLERIMTGHRG